MKKRRPPAGLRAFTEDIRAREDIRYPGAFADTPVTVSERRFWHFRPSHHAATGLLTPEDVALLAQPEKRLLSVGAYPALFERLLPDLGVPPENVMLADSDARILACDPRFPVERFDMLQPWPDIGTFDRIIFPESLCIALTDALAGSSAPPENDRTVRDAREATLLAHVLREALKRLRPGGILRANGPMSHPKVLAIARHLLQEKIPAHARSARRFFLQMHRDNA